YDHRIAQYVKERYFPVKSKTTSRQKIITSNPFLPALHETTRELVITQGRLVVAFLEDESNSNSSELYFNPEKISAENFIDAVFEYAIDKSASDINFLSFQSSMRIRFFAQRAWGAWRGFVPVVHKNRLLRALAAAAVPPKDHESGVRLDYKVQREIRGVITEWRVTVIPTSLGEEVVIRKSPQIGKVPSLEELGFSDDAIKFLARVRMEHEGMALIVGATGSGKTMTLYSMMSEYLKLNKKVNSIENPVELVIPGVAQSQFLANDDMSDKYKMDYLDATRSFMRAKPDIIIVGESRDAVELKATMNLGSTGHFVYTTMHTSSVPATIQRLRIMDIDPTLLADSLKVIVSQRLVQTLCPHCRHEHDDGTASRNHDGCIHCSGSTVPGVMDATVAPEIAFFDEQSRIQFAKGTPIAEIINGLEGRGLYLSREKEILKLVSRGLIDRSYAEHKGSILDV
ncbi:MAG: ATPase, T2SS/T4P/T4SS family, partial [Thiomicrospira sp.]